MSEDSNKPIIKKAQELLKEYGHEVKTGHLYEIFSKLADERSWNVASAKHISFKDKVLNVLKKPTININIEIEVDEFKNKYLEWYKMNSAHRVALGVLKDKNLLLLKDMTMEPNALFIGATGSGKSVAMASSVVSFFKKNPEKTVAFLVDPFTGANELQALFDFPKVKPVLSTEKGLLHTIDLLRDELLKRRDEFNRLKVESIYKYEEVTKKPLDRCLLVLENFHQISNYTLDFKNNYQIEGTPANKFHQLMRLGRSYGIWIFAASSKASKSDLPLEILNNFSNKFVFRTSASEALYIDRNFLGAADITIHEKGLCLSDFGKIQFPNFSIKEQEILLKDTPKVLETNCLFINNKIFSAYLEEYDEEMNLKNKSLMELSSLLNKNNKEKILKAILEKKGFSIIKEFNPKLDDSGINFILEKNKKQIAVAIHNTVQIKHLFKMNEAISKFKTERAVIFSLEEIIPHEIQKKVFDIRGMAYGIELIDLEGIASLT